MTRYFLANCGMIARQVAELALAPALRSADEATPILADGFSCRTQIAALSGRRAQHLAEVLAARIDPAEDPLAGG